MDFPIVPPDVLLALSKVFPEQAPNRHEPLPDLMFRGGQVSVVRFLQRQFDEQNENILTSEFQDVPSEG